jgi:hypothetical protein
MIFDIIATKDPRLTKLNITNCDLTADQYSNIANAAASAGIKELIITDISLTMANKAKKMSAIRPSSNINIITQPYKEQLPTKNNRPEFTNINKATDVSELLNKMEETFEYLKKITRGTEEEKILYFKNKVREIQNNPITILNGAKQQAQDIHSIISEFSKFVESINTEREYSTIQHWKKDLTTYASDCETQLYDIIHSNNALEKFGFNMKSIISLPVYGLGAILGFTGAIIASPFYLLQNLFTKLFTSQPTQDIAKSDIPLEKLNIGISEQENFLRQDLSGLSRELKYMSTNKLTSTYVKTKALYYATWAEDSLLKPIVLFTDGYKKGSSTVFGNQEIVTEATTKKEQTHNTTLRN